ncbi:MAG: crotonase/enoyl-CoA hydratase family protein [Gammaproteobacteria bacterium]|nr:crotonase/enoyl-CoA hydratase family protein [Gammaproteobacteria bacterium]
MNDRVRMERDGPVVQVTLTRGDRHNGMDLPMLDGVRAAARRLRRDPDVRTVILAGEGPSFCAGLDVKAVLGRPGIRLMALAALISPVRNRFQDWSLGWRDVPAPVIAAIHGNCFGAGFQLALGADIRIATPGAQISVMEAKWGLVPDMGGTVLLRELVPIDIAKELTMTGRTLTGMEAHALGLVTHISPDPVAHARALAAEIGARSPDSVAASKFLLQEAWSRGTFRALAAERKWQRRVIGRRNQRIAVRRNLEQADVPFEPRRIRS